MTSRWVGAVMLLALLLTAGCSVPLNTTDLQPPEETIPTGTEVSSTSPPGEIHDATTTPTTLYPVSKEEAREIALNDPGIQEDIRGYTIETEVRTGQMGPPDAEISNIVYIHVFDPETGEQIITHLVAVSYKGEITSKYYLTPPKIPPDLPENLT
jgi:hypothetical protein